MLSHYIFVGLGGAFGSIARVALSKIIPATFLGMPLPILGVNILGCFVIGLLTEFFALHSAFPDNLRYLLIAGFLGGFTTFSTFALEFGLLYEKHLYIAAICYATLSFVLSIIFFFLGIKLIRLFS
jgi:CrcB protein